jgi:glutaredoxin
MRGSFLFCTHRHSCYTIPMPFKRHHEVTIYSSTGSAMCDLTKAYFRNADIDFEEVNITGSEENKKAMIEATNGIDRAPVVIIDGRVVAGYQPDVYDILIKESEKGGGK